MAFKYKGADFCLQFQARFIFASRSKTEFPTILPRIAQHDVVADFRVEPNFAIAEAFLEFKGKEQFRLTTAQIAPFVAGRAGNLRIERNGPTVVFVSVEEPVFVTNQKIANAPFA